MEYAIINDRLGPDPASTYQYSRHYQNLVQDEHKEIVKAIERRDPAAAALAAETHLRNAAKRLNKYLRDQTSGILVDPESETMV